MGSNRRGIRFVRWCYRTLILVAALAVAAGMLVNGGPARAATSGQAGRSAQAAASAQAAESVLAAKMTGAAGSARTAGAATAVAQRQTAEQNRTAAQSQALPKAARALGVTAVTPPSGNVTIDVDPGISYDKTTMQQLINQVQGENSRLSDTFKRLFQDDADTASIAEAPEFSTANDWQDFDGTLAEDSDGTGISVTIPAAEAQAETSATWWQQVVAVLVGGAVLLIVRATCVGALVAIGGPIAAVGKAFCAAVGNFFGIFVRGWMVQAFEGTTGDAGQWAITIAEALAGAVAPSLWESGINSWAENSLPGYLTTIGNWLATKFVQGVSWLGSTITAGVQAVGGFLTNVGNRLGDAVRNLSVPDSPSGQSCDIYAFYGTPCAAAYSTVRALSATYNGPLYEVQRASDNTTADIYPLSPGGYANAAAQDSFCASTTCTITRLYDQSYSWNDLTVEGAGGAAGADHAADASALPVTANGHNVYGLDVTGQVGYRDNNTNNIAVNGEAEGMYMVASGTHVNDGCCFDFGNAETNTRDNGNGHMDAVNLSTTCYFQPCSGGGPWVEADMENGLFQGGNGSNTNNKGNGTNFVTALLKNNGQTTYALKGGNAQSGGLSTWYDGALPNLGGYAPMQQEGAIVLGTGGDNSNSSIGSFFEGVMTQGYPSDDADNAVQANIVSASYSGNSNGNGGSGSGTGSGGTASANQAVVHQGYTSVYTVDSANGHLQESYLPAMGDPWSTQDLSAKYGTPPVEPGTKPVALTHDGYTSVFTIDASDGHVQETYLSNIGNSWATHDLTSLYGTPVTSWTPTAVVHDGYTSVYTVDESNGHLQETYLPAIGDPWTTQDLSANYGTPQVQAGTSPVAIVHGGYTSVYTVDPSHDLQETYLPVLGGPWHTQDLSANYGTPHTAVTPTALVHDGYTSVYTVDDGSSHLQETYLPAIGDPWTSQDLSAKYGTPWVAPGTQPTAMYHTGYTSVYTVDGGSNHVQETYLSNIGNSWATQDFSAKYGTPPTVEDPIPLLHPDTSGNLTWSSVYTIGQFDNHLEESYLPAIGDNWTFQDLSAKYGTPPVQPTGSPTADWALSHDGYTSAFTVDKSNDDLQETYLSNIGNSWATHDLSSLAGTPTVMKGTAPVALYHAGYTSVYSIDASNGHLQETYLSGIGANWITQDLSAKYGTPAVRAGTSPTAVFHNAGYTSVYTVDASNGDLQETYLSNIGNSWASQDLSAKYGTPAVDAGTSPVAITHSGWTSVYTVDGNHDLQETYLPAIGASWTTQDLSSNYGTPATTVSPTALVHDGYTSVYTVDTGSNDLQETYLPAIGDPWTSQDLSAKYGTPTVAAGMAPVALFHTGYASVYTLDQGSDDLEETYLPAISDNWSSQDLSSKYGTPAANQPPSPLVHDDTNGGLDWTSLYSVDGSSDDLQETYLPAIGDSWTTQDLSSKYGTPPV